jgi:transcriptional regulator with XRE-family HTH domain
MATKQPSVDTLVRQRLRGLRSARGWSLEALAARTGFNASTISRLETGRRRLALDLLVPIAAALDTTIDELVDTTTDADVVIRPDHDEAQGITRWFLSRGGGSGSPVVVKMRLEARLVPDELRVHPGRDWFYVLSGTVNLHLGEREILVHAGQAADFSTMTPHGFGTLQRPAEMISIFDADGRIAHLRPPA